MSYNYNLANLTIDSVYQGYVLNNNKNGYQLTADELFNNGQDNILQDGIQTPGFFSGIPICSADLAFHNWFWRNVSVLLPTTGIKTDIGNSI